MNAATYRSDLTKEECVRRLEANAHPGGWWTPWAEGTISAKVRGNRFRLFAWGPVNVRGSCARLFYGRIEERDGKTCIAGRLRMHPIGRVFFTFWFGGLMTMAILLLALPASAWGSGPPPSPAWILGPLSMMLIGVGFLRFGRWLARGQEDSIWRFLTRELKAEPCGQGSPNPQGGANGRQPFSSETNRTSAAAASRRSP
jgi:hypothetical protein